MARNSVPNTPIFVPADPRRLLVLVPGHPWPDSSRIDEQLREYAAVTIRQWQQVARQHGTILVAPVFGARYPDFREGGSVADHVTALAQSQLPEDQLQTRVR